MQADRTARVTQVSSRRRSSSREARHRRTNYRIAIVAYLMAWVAAGIALGWPSTQKCLEAPPPAAGFSGALAQEAADGGVLEAMGACLPIAALDLFLWTMTGTAIGFVVYYVLRRAR
jgi:hypothetical protein